MKLMLEVTKDHYFCSIIKSKRRDYITPEGVDPVIVNFIEDIISYFTRNKKYLHYINKSVKRTILNQQVTALL